MAATVVKSAREYFETLATRFLPAGARGVDATFQFELAGDGGGTWHVAVKDGAFTVAEGPAAAPPTATIKMNAADYVAMANGELNGMAAFMKGQLKVSGNILLAQKMQTFFPPRGA